MVIVAAILVVATLIAMTTGRVPPVLALGIAICIAGILKIAPASALFAGLSNGGVITVGGMLVIAKGIVQTGIVIAGDLAAAVHGRPRARQALRRLIAPSGSRRG